MGEVGGEEEEEDEKGNWEVKREEGTGASLERVLLNMGNIFIRYDMILYYIMYF